MPKLAAPGSKLVDAALDRGIQLLVLPAVAAAQREQLVERGRRVVPADDAGRGGAGVADERGEHFDGHRAGPGLHEPRNVVGVGQDDAFDRRGGVVRVADVDRDAERVEDPLPGGLVVALFAGGGEAAEVEVDRRAVGVVRQRDAGWPSSAQAGWPAGGLNTTLMLSEPPGAMFAGVVIAGRDAEQGRVGAGDRNAR